MVIQVTEYLKRTNAIDDNSQLPLLNSLFMENYSIWSTVGPDTAFKVYVNWARKVPALMGLLNVLTTDIISDEITFKPLDGDVSSGRNRIQRAQEFARVNRFRKVLEAQLVDGFICGVMYGWIGKLKEDKLRDAVRHAVTTTQNAFYQNDKTNQQQSINGVQSTKTMNQANNTQATTKLTYGEMEQLYERAKNGDLSSMAKKLRHVPASTMNIKSSEYDVVQYVQRVNGRFKIFETDEIIQIDLMPMDGKPYPFAPFEAVLSEVYLLWLITQNHLSFFENGGYPDKVFILPKELSGSQNHRFMIETLKKYKKVQNKHGNLVFTGEIKIEDLQNFEATMEHQNLGLYLVGVLAMMYGIPSGRIPFLIGKAANLGDTGGLADSGYWRKISVWQADIEEAYNQALWEPYFGVKMQFARQYKQDEIREVQIEMDKNAIAEQRLQMGLWRIEDAADFLGIDPDVVAEAQAQKQTRDEAQASIDTGMLQQGRNTKDNTINEPDEKFKNSKRQSTQQKNNVKATGKNITP